VLLHFGALSLLPRQKLRVAQTLEYASIDWDGEEKMLNARNFLVADDIPVGAANPIQAVVFAGGFHTFFSGWEVRTVGTYRSHLF
jgi:hypothetical protein